MHPLAADLLEKAKNIHDQVYEQIFALRSIVQEPGQSMEELADIGFVLKKSLDNFEALNTELRSLETICARAACVLWAKQPIDPSQAQPIITEYVRATPDIKQMCALPNRKREPEAYARMMQYLGVPQNLVGSAESRGPIDVDWPGMVDYLENQLAAGKPLPPGLDPKKMYSVYKLSYRAVKK